jgi:hypothetical protein
MQMSATPEIKVLNPLLEQARLLGIQRISIYAGVCEKSVRVALGEYPKCSASLRMRQRVVDAIATLESAAFPGNCSELAAAVAERIVYPPMPEEEFRLKLARYNAKMAAQFGFADKRKYRPKSQAKVNPDLEKFTAWSNRLKAGRIKAKNDGFIP